jgi:hypothetical protein
MTPGTGKFFTNSNEQPEQEGDIVAELRDWAEIIDRVNNSGTAMVTMISGAVHREAADEIERLRTQRDNWKKVAELFDNAYTTDTSGQFTIPNGSDLFRAIMAYERALRDAQNS